MDFSVILQLAIVLGAIYLGARMGSIGIGFAGGLGVLALAIFQVPVNFGRIPVDVMLIIMSVICAIAAMQVAGGVDWLVVVTERLLRKHPRYITYLAPIVTYLMTVMAGTGHTAFSTLPVIAEVAKEEGIRPSRPLSIAVVSSQVAITASPISAAVVFYAGELEKNFNVGYLTFLAICIPTTFLAVMITAFIANHLGKDLKDDPVYQERLAKGLVQMRGVSNIPILPTAKRSVLIFVIAIVAVMIYAVLISNNLGIIEKPTITRDSAIITFMLTAATLIVLFCKIDISKILTAQTFKSGMSASVCILGVAWLGTTFVDAHTQDITRLATDLVSSQPWLLAVAYFFASMLLYSQASTAKAIWPAAIAVLMASVAAGGISEQSAAITLVGSFAAVSALFILPTYPTLLAAVEMDDTGSTRIGKYVFNHPFLIPGTVCIVLSVVFGFIWGGILLS
ncbi:Anaerobic C4-dicarboxylate transporter DcuA [Saezia sanguinis]|uniref:C4-dicarboxylate transporter n=1 Tax=Saezia sanguinis TaxID=1965230 RepID=A0A433SH55_9BURK|nr:anaerobic C4-dicarboxylate transporter [Saezia sanguinis]RUS68075.1 Anaerobic C4-dicarboxylate transporter DcuA [Saezia sanguinis]